MSIDELGDLLERLNEEYAAGNLCRPRSVYRLGIIEKCKKHNMWLFLERSIPVEHIESLLTKKIVP